MKLFLSKLKLDPRPAIKWPGAGGDVPVDKRVTSEVSGRRWFSAGHAAPVDVVVARLARGRKVIMVLSTQTCCHGIYNERHWLSRVIAG